MAEAEVPCEKNKCVKFSIWCVFVAGGCFQLKDLMRTLRGISINEKVDLNVEFAVISSLRKSRLSRRIFGVVILLQNRNKPSNTPLLQPIRRFYKPVDRAQSHSELSTPSTLLTLELFDGAERQPVAGIKPAACCVQDALPVWASTLMNIKGTFNDRKTGKES